MPGKSQTEGHAIMPHHGPGSQFASVKGFQKPPSTSMTPISKTLYEYLKKERKRGFGLFLKHETCRWCGYFVWPKPPEMLAAIFVHLSKQELPSPGREALYLARDLVSVTHVCRFWRQAAINAPELWTDIPMISAEAVKVFLERSGELPLNVDLRLSSNHDVLDTVIPHTHRFRELSLHVEWRLCSSVPIPFTKPAPLLERLKN